MKKLLLFIATAATALLLTSCNSDSKPFGTLFLLSLEEGFPNNHLIDGSGVKLTPGPSSISIPSISNGLHRERVHFAQFYYVDGIDKPDENNEWKVDFTTIMKENIITKSPDLWGSAEYNDPILFPYVSLDGYLPSNFEPFVNCHQNYLDAWCLSLAFTKNKPSNLDYAEVEYQLEINPDIVTSTTGGPDTVRMALKFWNNRADGEAITRATWYTPISFDIENAPYMINDFDMYDDQSKAKTYIIKMEYNAFDDHQNPKDGDTSIKFVTAKWTPADPFKVYEN